MKNLITKIKIFLCLAGVCLVVGFFTAASSPSNVFVGIVLMIAGVVFAGIALIPTIKLIRLQNKEKEEG